jgi:hypothetical protein
LTPHLKCDDSKTQSKAGRLRNTLQLYGMNSISEYRHNLVLVTTYARPNYVLSPELAMAAHAYKSTLLNIIPETT